MADINVMTGEVLDLSIRIHRAFGPGLLESVYEHILAGRLVEMGYRVERQKPIDIEFEGKKFDAAFRIDLLIGSRLIIELKSVERLAPVHTRQLLTYLRLMDLPVGLLINFWRGDTEGRFSQDRQQIRSLCALRVSARKNLTRKIPCSISQT